MKKPKRDAVFQDAQMAVSALVDYAGFFCLPSVDLAPADIARSSVAGACTKALSRKCAGAADMYRTWADQSVPSLIKSMRYVINQEQYDRLVRKAGLDLLRIWRDQSPDRLALAAFGEAFRVIDRLFMSINESQACRSGAIQGYLHVPLDGATLKPLRLCVDELLGRDFAVAIPSVIPPGFVSTEELYSLLEEAIFTLAARAGVPPIVYAYYCQEL